MPLQTGKGDRSLEEVDRDSLQQQLARLQQELDEVQPLCLLADLISPVAHELQNILNSMLLQAAIAERAVPAEARKDLSKIRQLGVQAGDVMKQFNHYRYTKSAPRYPVDLNEIVQEFQKSFVDDAGVEVRWELGPDVPPIHATKTDAQRMVSILVRQAVGCTSANKPSGLVICQTRWADGCSRFCVNDQGGSLDADGLKRLFQFTEVHREGADGVELLACQALVRRMGGTLRVNQTDDGLCIAADFETLGNDERRRASES